MSNYFSPCMAHLKGKWVWFGLGRVTGAWSYNLTIRWLGIWEEGYHFSEWPSLCINNPKAGPGAFQPFADE